MKRIELIITGISLSVLLLGTGVWADITIPDATGPALVYETSPNVLMAYGVNATTNVDGYFVTSVNSKGTIEYGIISSYSGYYQQTNEGATAATPATNAIADWTASGSMQ